MTSLAMNELAARYSNLGRYADARQLLAHLAPEDSATYRKIEDLPRRRIELL